MMMVFCRMVDQFYSLISSSSRLSGKDSYISLCYVYLFHGMKPRAGSLLGSLLFFFYRQAPLRSSSFLHLCLSHLSLFVFYGLTAYAERTQAKQTTATENSLKKQITKRRRRHTHNTKPHPSQNS